MRNWAGNIVFGTSDIRHPASIAELQSLVAGAAKLRAIGSRHSFNALADSTAMLVSLERMPERIEIDRIGRQVRVSGHLPYSDLCRRLHAAGFALHNLASLPHITVAGAVATATHGSGVRNPCLAAGVAAIELVTASGERRRLARGDEGFDGAVVGLGAVGVVVELTLDLLPAFGMRQHVYLGLPMAEVDARFDTIMASAYSVSLFTTWQDDRVDQVWVKRRSDDPDTSAGRADFFGAQPATAALHPVVTMAAGPCTAQLGEVGPWHERLPHFRHDQTPSAGDELQSEYFVARRDAPAALRAIDAMRDAIAPLLLVSEIRTVAADALWMSMCHGRESVGIHFTWKPDWSAVRAVLPRIEAALAPFGARPHWGKLFTLAPRDLRARYERLPAFLALLREVDPGGKLRNPFLDALLFDG